MRLEAGSALWLLKWEIKIAWRRAASGRGAVLLGLGALVFALLHLLAWPLVAGFRAELTRVPVASSLPFALIGAALFALTLMLSTAITQSVATLFDRGDLDLVLASPIAPQRIFLVRAAGVALSTLLAPALLLWPVANVAALYGLPRWLGMYPTLVAWTLLCAAIGFALTVWLVRALGPRRARVVGQTVGALVGALLYLASQAHTLLPTSWRAWFSQSAAHWFLPGGALAGDSAAWWPLRALFAQPLPLLATLAVSIVLFALAVRWSWASYLGGFMLAQSSSTSRARAASSPIRFAPTLARAVRAKEWRLLRRDPQLIASVGLQTLYLLPLVAILARGDGAATLGVAAGMTALTGSLAGSLAWLTVAADDAHELLALSPASPQRLRWLKLSAALWPLWAVCLPLALIATISAPRVGLAAASGAFAASVAVGVLQVWGAKPATRDAFNQRGKRQFGLLLLEWLTIVAWSTAAAGFAQGRWWTLVAAVIGVIVPLIVWQRARSRGGWTSQHGIA